MRRIWYSRGYRILHEGRILHAIFTLAAPHGVSDAPWIKEASGYGCAAADPNAGPTSATECQRLVPAPGQSRPRGTGVRAAWRRGGAGLEVG
jgi:hypothetical protein